MLGNACDAHFSEIVPLIASAPALPFKAADSALATIEDPTATPMERISAGAVLSLAGDPRAHRTPSLLLVDGGQATVGTAVEDVDPVVRKWSRYGVERDWILKEVPQHSVTVSPLWFGAYQVTNEQYLHFLRTTGHQRRPSTWYLGAYPWERSNHPVCGVSLQDAQAYCAWLSLETNTVVRLPTEAEWEYAAAGPQRREYPWGDEFDESVCNTFEFGLHTTCPIGSFPAGRSWCGLWDMAGNVEELTASTYAPYPNGSSIADDLVDALGEYPISRGGSFSRYGDLARTRRRHGPHPGKLYPCGFRIVCENLHAGALLWPSMETAPDKHQSHRGECPTCDQI